MFGIKKKGREQATKLHKIIVENAAPFVNRLSHKLRLSGRKRLFCRWGRNNPKRVVAMYGIFVVVILCWNILGLVGVRNVPQKHSDPLKLAEMSSVSNPFDGMMTINQNREMIRNTITSLAETNLMLAHRLDSLINLDSLSKRDSIEIASIYNRLNIKTDNNYEP